MMYWTEIQGVGEDMTNEEIVQKIKQGEDVQSNLQLLFEQNRKFLWKTVKKYEGIMEHDDLMQEAFLGLWKAVDKYDESQGVLFLTYAGHWIFQVVSRYVQDNAYTIRVPVHMHSVIFKYNEYVRQYVNKYGKEPTSDEVKSALKINGEQYMSIIRTFQQTKMTCLDEPVLNDGDGNETVGSLCPSDIDIEQDIVQKVTEEEMLNFVLDLKDRERRVIFLRYGQGMTLQECGDKMNLTKERVRQIESDAMKNLRRKMKIVTR